MLWKTPDSWVRWLRKACPLSLHYLLFSVLLAYWTYMLLKANPVPERFLEGFSLFDRELLLFILAKTLHLASYTFMTLLGCTMVAPRHRKWIVVGLILHGIATEIGQHLGSIYFDTNRTGRVRDVVIDTTGVFLGSWLLMGSRTWAILTQRTPPTPAVAAPGEASPTTQSAHPQS